MTNTQRGALPDQATEPVVAFYLAQETDLPARYQYEYQVVPMKVPNSLGLLVEKPALRVTFSHNQSVEEPVGLIGFGSDPRCHVLLPSESASQVHCKIYAQLNSGSQCWLVEDTSEQGTRILDNDTPNDTLNKLVHGRRQAARGLRSLTIGPYKFRIILPLSRTEIRRSEKWFQLNKPVPVTSSMLTRQLCGRDPAWLRLKCVGEGGNAKVYRYMETNTALFIAIKEQEATEDWQKKAILKEINFMKTLRHVSCCNGLMTFADSKQPFLVDILFDESDNKPCPMIFTGMPLYLGHLTSVLPLPNMSTIERVMLQIAEGLDFMHSHLILHRDLKPDNILVSSPGNIKIADYGWATSLKDIHSLYGVCGTTAYCAPEALKMNEIHTVAIDVYSLGAIYYHMLDLDEVNRGWVRRMFRGRPEWFNTTFENAFKSPPNRYPGLIQSMLAPDLTCRCSLKKCIGVVKAQRQDWKYQPRLTPVATATHHTTGQLITHRTVQDTPFSRGVKAPNIDPFAGQRLPRNRQRPEPAAAKHGVNNLQAAPLRAPCKTARAQGVDFNAGLPSYEEATRANPFATKAPREQGDKHSKLKNRTKEAKEPTLEKEASSSVKPTPPAKSRSRQRVGGSRRHRNAINIHRAHDAGIHRRREQPDRQAARNKQLAKLKKGACDVAKGTWGIGSALLWFACDGLVVGGERLYKMLKDDPAARFVGGDCLYKMVKDDPAAREAVEHATSRPRANVDARLIANLQRHPLLRSYTGPADGEVLGRQLMSRRR